MPALRLLLKVRMMKQLYDFINKSIPYHKRKTIVTDYKKSYDDIMRKLGFKYHQHCLFHLLQRINKLINNEVNNYKKEFKTDLKKTNPNYSDSKVNKLTKKAGKKYRKQFEVYHDEIKSIFDCEKYEDAVSTVESIWKKIDEYPEFLSEYLIKNFFPEYKKYIVYLK